LLTGSPQLAVEMSAGQRPRAPNGTRRGGRRLKRTMRILAGTWRGFFAECSRSRMRGLTGDFSTKGILDGTPVTGRVACEGTRGGRVGWSGTCVYSKSGETLDAGTGQRLHLEGSLSDLITDLFGTAGRSSGRERTPLGILEGPLEMVAVHRHGGEADRRRHARL